MSTWVRLIELGDRRCDAVKFNWNDIQGKINGGFNYCFSRVWGECVPTDNEGSFRFDLAGSNVVDYNLNGGYDVNYGSYIDSTQDIDFAFGDIILQGNYNDKDYYITVNLETKDVMWEWTEPLYYYGDFYRGFGTYDDEPVAAEGVYVRLYEGGEVEPDEPTQPTIEDNLNRIQQAKSDIKAAIESKGVYVDEADKIDIYASKIYEIEQGGGSANIGKRTFTIQENGQTDYLSWDFGYDGWNQVTIRSRVQNPFYTVSQAIEYGATDRPYPAGDYIFVTGRVSEITNIREDGRYSFIITDEVNTMTITNSSLVNDISEIQVNDYVVIRGLLGKTGNTLSSNPTLFLKYSNTGGGSCNLGQLNADFADLSGDGRCWWYPNEQGLDGFNYVSINASAYGEQKKSDGIELGKVYAAEEAITLDVTSNGTYYTKYADVPEWTEPETGDGEFYSYITAQENALSTGYKGDTNTVVELWYRHYGDVSNGAIIQRASFSNAFKLMLTEETGTVIVGSNSFDFYLPAHQFNKIRFSTKGIWVNDEQVSEFDVEYTNDTPVWEIGGVGNLAQGDYGMVKIDDNVYIPTADGFLYTATNEILPSVTPILSDFKFTFTEVMRPVFYENLIKQVNVNISNRINIEEQGIRLGHSKFSSIPDNMDFSQVTSMSNMFYNCPNLSDISLVSDWDTSKITDMSNMFNGCSKLEDITPLSNWDFSGISDTSKFMSFLSGVKVKDYSPLKDSNMFKIAWANYYNTYIEVSYCEIFPQVECSYIPFINEYSEIKSFTTFGGLVGLKYGDTSDSKFPRYSAFTYESWKNLIDGLYDFTGNGETPSSNQGKLKLHPNAYTLLTEDDIAIATSRGWTLS